jgi:hypothetical protein
MAILSISEASRRWRLGRSNLYRAVKSGRLNLSARPDGSRGIDTSELVRVFGEPSAGTTANIPPLSGASPPTTDPDDREQARTPSPVNLLQAQVNQLTDQLEQSHEREVRLLALLEAEQQARRDLEQKLLPPPPPPQPEPPPRRHRRPWLLLAILALAVAALVWTRTGAYWPLDG